jgi:aspartate kinase
MANTTDQLQQLAFKVHPNPPSRELAMMISAGERISIALLAMALSLKGKEAVSFTGSQSGIITCENHTFANIIDVRPFKLLPVLDRGQVVIVAGFQGVSKLGNITTLGRGGSDTTAIALAAALGASEVEFYKDVLGVYDSDPKENPSSKLFSELSFQQAIDIVSSGAKILHPRSLRLAHKNGIRLVVRSFNFADQLGTLIGAGIERSLNTIYEMEG